MNNLNEIKKFLVKKQIMSGREAMLVASVCTTNLFQQLLPKGEDLPFWERIYLAVSEELSPFGRHKI